MNTLIPAPDTIPVAWGYFQFLLMLMFPIHLVLMNAMLGSTAIAAYACLKRDEIWKNLAHELAKVIPLLIAFAVNFGVAALLFLQVLYGNFFYASSVLMGAFWISIIPLLVLAYYGAYIFDFRFLSLKNTSLVIVLPILVIFLFVAFVLSNNMTLMLNPDHWSVYFKKPAGTSLNFTDPAFFPRYFHFIVGALAVGGLFVALFGRFKKTLGADVRAAAENIGMKVFTFLTGIQIVTGFWFLSSLPRKVMVLFMGGNVLATLLFFAGLSLALSALVAGTRRKVYVCAGLVVPLIYMMVSIRDMVRSGYLQPYFSLESLQVVPQYSPMFMFFSVLVAGLVTIAWLLRKALGSFSKLEAED
jgi:hypothetical protein